MTYALDSDVFTPAHHDRVGMRGRLDHVLKASDGADIRRAFGWLATTEAYLAALPFDAAAEGVCDRLRVGKRARGMGRGDLLVASVALAHGAVLVTRNAPDFAAVPELRVENWAG